MVEIHTASDLKQAIAQLENKKAGEFILLKEQYIICTEGFKLSNIIGYAVKEVVSSPSLGKDMLNTAIGLTTGIVAKKIFIGKTINPIKKLAGVLLEMAVANKVANNAGFIKTAGKTILEKLFGVHQKLK
jgi:hypothetical protein